MNNTQLTIILCTNSLLPLAETTMDPLPPNDPNRNNNNNAPVKPDPTGGGGEVDVFGNLHEQPAVVMMFLIGVASWLLAERCTC